MQNKFRYIKTNGLRPLCAMIQIKISSSCKYLNLISITKDSGLMTICISWCKYDEYFISFLSFLGCFKIKRADVTLIRNCIY